MVLFVASLLVVMPFAAMGKQKESQDKLDEEEETWTLVTKALGGANTPPVTQRMILQDANAMAKDKGSRRPTHFVANNILKEIFSSG